MSAKPYHAGHDKLVRLASSESEVVQLFVSLSDRHRTGELAISGAAMNKIWKAYIEPTLPSNVLPPLYGGVPVSRLFNLLGKAEKEGSDDTFIIFADEEDLHDYKDAMFFKHVPTLFANGQIKRRGISRLGTVNISGTRMRELLRTGNTEEFKRQLPASIQQHGQEIIDILREM